MATFFGEVVAGSYRYFDDEDEDALDNARDLTFQLRDEVSEKEGRLLLVAEGRLAAAFLHLLLGGGGGGDMQLVTEIQTGGSSRRTVARIFRNGSCTVVYCGEGVVSHQDSLPLATIILSLVTSQALVIPLTARHSSELQNTEALAGSVGEELGSSLGLCLVTPKYAGPLPCSRLVQPNLVSGLSAALLTLAIVRGLAAVLLVNYVDVLAVDSLALAGFQALLKVPEVGGAGLSLPAHHLPHKLKQINLLAPDSNLYL